MELEIAPEPTEDERAAIAAALAEPRPEAAPHTGPWRDEPEEP